MRKEELRKLKRINATPKMVHLAQNNKAELRYKRKWSDSYLKRDTRYDLLVRCQSRGKYLMVCIFLPEDVAKGDGIPLYEIYCNPEGNEYITRIMINGREQKWSTAMADNLGRISGNMWNYYGYRNIESRIWQSHEGKREIKEFLNTEESGIWGLIEWQKKTHDKRIKEAEKREQAPWDADMKLVPEIMPSFEGWMLKEAAPKYFLFYEYDPKEAKTAYCSHCGHDVPAVKPRHNKEAVCPHCRVKAQYKVASKIQTLSTDEYRAQVIQKIQGGIVVRTFRQKQWYRDCSYRNPEHYTEEEQRVLIFEDGSKKYYDYALYKNRFRRWIKDNSNGRYSGWRGSLKLYSGNLKKINSQILKNSAMDLWDKLPASVPEYLSLEAGNPTIEKFARIGMFRMAKNMIEHHYDRELLDQNATELTKILKIDGARLKRLKAMDGRVAHLKWFQMEKLTDRVYPNAMIKDLGNADIIPSDFGFLTPPLKYVKIWNYMKKQSAMSGERISQVIRTWEDYLNMAEKAKMNVKSEMIYKPKNLKSAHQEVIFILKQGALEKQAEKLEKKWPKVNENVQKLKKFEYEDKKYCIVAPAGILDIVKEGTALNHCVHTCDFYFDRIHRDETYLFFLRKTECREVPWYTLEVEASGNIRQKRTTGDNQNKDFEEAVKFLKKWQKEYLKRMTAEEKELGIKANQARLQEYEKLRKDGNRVWHGKLAGQLLADVLENDFMAAAGI